MALPGEEDELATVPARLQERCLPGRGKTYRHFLFRSRLQGPGGSPWGGPGWCWAAGTRPCGPGCSERTG
ncbi:unnamed protein product [Caretta caretta]